MNFEDKLRELAEKATPAWEGTVEEVCRFNGKGPWISARGPRQPEDWYSMAKVSQAKKDAEHIAFNDPQTAKLVADVIAAARRVEDYAYNYLDVPAHEMVVKASDILDLRRAIRTLDAHHAEREGK